MSRRRKTPQRASRGLLTRLFSMMLGTMIAGVMIVAMQVPFLHERATSRLTLDAIKALPGSTPPIAWPLTGSAALIIPSLDVAQSWHNDVVPIASLAKMMTAYVTLKRLPLAQGATGPCLTISASDVAAYDEMKVTGQSAVAVATGESLCEIDLLGGLMVHSANNFALLLATLVSGNVPSFVVLMNQTAQRLGLTHTHYVEPSGYVDGSVSTALEQGELAVLLMKSPLIRSIVLMPSITLPVAGTVTSFTPFIGTDNVIGVKSGRTDAAGGCDVMAMTFKEGASTRVLYAVVLGQRGGNLLGPAGIAAFNLATSARANELDHYFVKGARFATLGWGSDRAAVGLRSGQHVWWWAGAKRLPLTLVMKRPSTSVRRGQLVGWLVVHGATTHRFALVAERTVSPPSLWQRLR